MPCREISTIPKPRERGPFQKQTKINRLKKEKNLLSLDQSVMDPANFVGWGVCFVSAFLQASFPLPGVRVPAWYQNVNSFFNWNHSLCFVISRVWFADCIRQQFASPLTLKPTISTASNCPTSASIVFYSSFILMLPLCSSALWDKLQSFTDHGLKITLF